MNIGVSQCQLIFKGEFKEINDKLKDNEIHFKNKYNGNNVREILSRVEAEKQNYNTMINVLYKKYFDNNDIYIYSEDNINIKFYKLNIFNLEKKKELKDLLNIHTSEELVKMKLEGLYEKKISILSK